MESFLVRRGVSAAYFTRRDAPWLSSHPCNRGRKCGPLQLPCVQLDGAEHPKFAFSKAFSRMFCFLVLGRADAVLQVKKMRVGHVSYTLEVTHLKISNTESGTHCPKSCSL